MTSNYFYKVKTLLLVIIYFIAVCSATLCYGHDELLHRRITQSVFDSSSGLNSFLIDSYGTNTTNFAAGPQLSSQPLPFVTATNQSPRDWLIDGSYWEDMTVINGYTLRSVNHFYTVMPSRIPGAVNGLTDRSESPLHALPSGITNSFAWASQRNLLGPSQTFIGSVNTNQEAWPNARDYEYSAITNALKSSRDDKMAHMLYALGHVLHLNQDASQPDHVRNDNHYIVAHRYIEVFGAKTYLNEANGFPLKPHGWNYWNTNGFNKMLDFWDRGLYTNASALNNDAGNVPSTQLGIAEFANGNFIGEDAVYAEYFKNTDIQYFPFPSLMTSTSFPKVRKAIDKGTNTSFLKNGKAILRIRIQKTNDGIFVTNHSVLNYLGAKAAQNGNALVRVASTIDDTNVLQEYHSVLIPKAIEYSAGILDYYFRGNVNTIVRGGTNGTFDINVCNSSTQDFNGGSFHLFYDDENAVRTEITDNFATLYTTSLIAGSSVDANFTAPANAVNFVLLYKGTVGAPSGLTFDSVDTGIAIAVKNFTVPQVLGSTPSGAVGSGYSATITSIGIDTPTFTLDGSLPGGLSLDADGNITGTPTTSGTFTFGVVATDGFTSFPYEQSFAITINGSGECGCTPCCQ